MAKIKVALIGAGQRGKDVYGNYALKHSNDIEYVAVAEPNEIKRKEFMKKHGIKEEYAFKSWEPLLDKERFCDAVVIATPDNTHYKPAKKALEKGYHMLLEKPMSNDARECIKLGRLAKKLNRVFMICHVLRYTPFYSTIKKLIEDKTIGRVMSIEHSENIGYYHFAHSFVRGNWRNSDESSPLILQKSCHDMDILLWLTGKRCKKISSYGTLSYFKPENAFENAGDRCLDCDGEKKCPFSAKKLYYKYIGGWPTTVITEAQTEESVTKALEEGPYGRCVFNCDNNVPDHQVTIMEFEDGINITFNLSAFTNGIHRSIKIMGAKGEIIGDDSKNEIEVNIFGSNEKKIITPERVAGGHGGGDNGIMNDFVSLLLSKKGKALTSADVSVESHIMAFAAEESRLSNKAINMEEFYKKF